MEEELWTLDVYEVRIQQSLTTTTGRVLVSKVKLNKSVGPDGISRKILRELANYLAAPIMELGLHFKVQFQVLMTSSFL